MKTRKDLQGARRSCYRLLKVRSRSEKELRDRLHVQGFDSGTINKAIFELSKIGLINDKAFARLWVESRSKRPLGAHRLASELQAKGIHKQIIAQVLDECSSPRNEEAAIRQVLEAKMKRLKGLDKKKIRERLWGFFLRKGYSKDVVFDVLNEL